MKGCAAWVAEKVIGNAGFAGTERGATYAPAYRMPDRYGNDHAHTVEYGIRCVKMDPLIVLTTMGMAMEKVFRRLPAPPR